MKNICERLLLRVFLYRFPIWANNIASEEDVSSNNKTKETVLKLRYITKTCLFMMCFIISFFSISPLYVSWRLPYIIKVDSSDSFKTAESMNGEFIHLCCRFSTYYLDLWARKCCIVNCIVIKKILNCGSKWHLET